MNNTAFIAGAIVLLAAAIVFSGLIPQQAPSNQIEKDASGAYIIRISDFSFVPQNINISKGETVKWNNLDSVMHSITSDSSEQFSSANIGSKENFTHTFNTAGVFSYHCGVHPQMKGKITVN